MDSLTLFWIVILTPFLLPCLVLASTGVIVLLLLLLSGQIAKNL